MTPNWNMKKVIFEQALDAWNVYMGGGFKDFEFCGEWQRMARVLYKAYLDTEFIAYARKKGYNVERGFDSIKPFCCR